MIRVRIPSNFMEKILLRRYSSGGYVDGLWVESDASEPTIRASVQPVSAAQMRLLPEGESPLKFRTVYTNQLMSVPDEGTNPDEIVYKGLTYKLFQFIDWSENGYTSAIFRQIKT